MYKMIEKNEKEPYGSFPVSTAYKVARLINKIVI